MKNLKIELKWAFIFIVMMLTWMLMERVLGFHDEKIDQHALISSLVFIPAILVYVLALLDKRKNFYNGSMNYLQGFIAGLFITLFVSLVSPLTQIIVSTIISPDYFPNIIAYTVGKGIMTQEAAEAHFNLNNYIYLTVIATPIMGILTSALVALFTIKKRK